MAIVAGVDFGTLSVRVSIVDNTKGRIGSAVAEYPLTRKKDDPDHATQKPADHMAALVKAMKQALQEAGVNGSEILALAIDTTGSTIVPVDKNLQPLDDYYLWCDHRAKKEAAEITAVAHREKLAAIDWCGGVYSSEWGFANCSTGCEIIPPRRGKWLPLSSIAIWRRRPYATSTIGPNCPAVFAPWGISGCITNPWEACPRKLFWSRLIPS
jgi:L-ribulokinase